LKTRKIADNLHVAVVTVDLIGVARLQPGALYSYDLTFAFAGNATSDLQGEGLLQDQTGSNRLDGVDPAAAPTRRSDSSTTASPRSSRPRQGGGAEHGDGRVLAGDRDGVEQVESGGLGR
jgi:hypothetical protein